MFVQMYVFGSEKANSPHTVTLIRILITVSLFSYPYRTPSALFSSFPTIAPFSVPGFPLLFHCTRLNFFCSPYHIILFSLCPCLDPSDDLSVCFIECLTSCQHFISSFFFSLVMDVCLVQCFEGFSSNDFQKRKAFSHISSFI